MRRAPLSNGANYVHDWGMRRLLAWLVCVPLVMAGTQLAHAVAYRVVQPDAAARQELLDHTGHRYLSALSLALALGWGIVLIGPLVFALQEHLERLIHDGTFPVTAALEPTFLIGVALQVPFALVALLVARLLLRVAERLGGLLVPSRPTWAPSPPHAAKPAAIDAFRPLHLRARLGIVRGPPAALLV
jgi:hypothetical protein